MKENIWRPITEDIAKYIGGLDNISKYYHCATRLRIEVIDEDKVDADGLKKLDKAKGVNKVGVQWQIIFGAGIVEKAYKDFNQYFIENATPIAGETSIKETVNNSQPWWISDQSFGENVLMSTKRGISEFAAIFIPLIPMFIAGGMSLAFNSLIGVIPGAMDNQLGIGFSKIFDTVGGAILGMLPILVAWSAMKRFGGPEVYGIGIGLILVAPGLLNSWSVQTPISIGLIPGQDALGYVVDQGWATIDTNGLIDAVLINGEMTDISLISGLPSGILPTDITANVIVAYNNGWTIDQLVNLQTTSGYENIDQAAGSLIGEYTVIWSGFAGGIFAIRLVGYQAQVFSALLASGLVYFVYRFMNKYTPEMIAIVAVPLATILLSTWLTLWIVGPIGRLISNSIAFTFQFLWNTTNFAWFGLGGFLMAFSYPLLVVTGLHQGFTAVEATIIAETAARYGESFTFITAVGSCTNVAVGGAILGYSVIVKDNGERSIGVSSGVTANLGITEPAIFGVNLELVYPMLASMIGAGIGGYFVGMTGTYATSMGSASWIGLVQFNPIVTDAYNQFMMDNGTNLCLTNWSPMLKEGIALTLSFISAFALTIVFSQTKWGDSYNKLRGVEVYSLIKR